MTSNLVRWKVGAELAARSFGPVTRTVLALYAGGSGDHNPIHLDPDVARAAGHPDVFVHGMLSMAYLAQYISGVAPADRLRSWSVRFTAITPVSATVTCSGRVVGWDEFRREATLALTARIEGGAETMTGEALIACDA